MPTYDFHCEKCGHGFERFLPITSGPTIKCPVCGGIARKKVSGGIGLIFKGTGFYETDYKHKKSDGGE